MSRNGVDTMRYLLDEAFADDHEHSLLANLRNVTAEDWHWKPEGGARAIRVITYHAGVAKYLYSNHLFGDASLTYEGVMRSAPVTKDEREMGVVIEWIRDGHSIMCGGLATIDDDALLSERRSHWGEMLPTRHLISVLIQHDIYHAGEINHLRALRHGDDRWPWQPS